eukprot:10526388-Lingulodinium_polyedra.AAC.1
MCAKRCATIRSNARCVVSARRDAARTARHARATKWCSRGACVRGACRRVAAAKRAFYRISARRFEKCCAAMWSTARSI